MKKRIVCLCLALLVTMLLVGCLRMEIKVKVNEDGKTADVRTMVAMSDELTAMADSESEDFTAEEIAELNAKGYTYEQYKDAEAGFTGYILDRAGVPLQEVNLSDMETGMDGQSDASIITVNGNHAEIRFVPITEKNFKDAGTYLPMIETYGGYLRFVLELPTAPTDHNATSVSEDGKTLTWNLTTLSPDEEIFATFDLPA